MKRMPQYQDTEDLFLAGERVAPGCYRQVGRYSRDILLENEGELPASLDGQVACYLRVNLSWRHASSLSRTETPSARL